MLVRGGAAGCHGCFASLGLKEMQVAGAFLGLGLGLGAGAGQQVGAKGGATGECTGVQLRSLSGACTGALAVV